MGSLDITLRLPLYQSCLSILPVPSSCAGSKKGPSEVPLKAVA